jgi:hypothetical protein
MRSRSGSLTSRGSSRRGCGTGSSMATGPSTWRSGIPRPPASSPRSPVTYARSSMPWRRKLRRAGPVTGSGRPRRLCRRTGPGRIRLSAQDRDYGAITERDQEARCGGWPVDRVVDRVPRILGAFRALCAFWRAIGAGSALRAGAVPMVRRRSTVRFRKGDQERPSSTRRWSSGAHTSTATRPPRTPS